MTRICAIISPMKFDVVVIGAGPAGLMCGIEAARRGRKVALLEGSHKIGQKLLMSGGGRCNFSNLRVTAENYISQNVPFVIDALAKFNIDRILSILKKKSHLTLRKERRPAFLQATGKGHSWRASKGVRGLWCSNIQRCNDKERG